jgi:hypothetical protein
MIVDEAEDDCCPRCGRRLSTTVTLDPSSKVAIPVVTSVTYTCGCGWTRTVPDPKQPR